MGLIFHVATTYLLIGKAAGETVSCIDHEDYTVIIDVTFVTIINPSDVFPVL